MKRRSVLIASALALPLAYLATGLAVVAPGETVVVRRFGRPLAATWGPGLHLGAPRGIDRRDRLRTDEVRRLEVGAVGATGTGDDPGAGESLSGDLNLVRYRAVVQYRVGDPLAFVQAGPESERLLARLAESALARALARRGIDDALRSGRVAVAGEAASWLADQAEARRLGLVVLGISLTDVRPPAEVQAAFDEAQVARSARERRRREALAYGETSLPAAEAEAQARTERARGEAGRLVALARSRADRFRALADEAARDRPGTVRRLYLDALRDGFGRVARKVVLAPGQPVDLTLYGLEGGPASPRADAD